MSNETAPEQGEQRADRIWQQARRWGAVAAVVIVVVVWATTRTTTPDAPTSDPTNVGVVPVAPAPTATATATAEPATDLPDEDSIDAGPVPEPDPVELASSEAASAAATAAVTVWWATSSTVTGTDRLVGLVTPDAVIADGPTIDDVDTWSTSATVTYVVPMDGTDSTVRYTVQLAYAALIPAAGDDPAVRLHGTVDQQVTVTQQADGTWLASRIDEPS